MGSKGSTNTDELVIRIPIGKMKGQVQIVGFSILAILALVLGVIFLPKLNLQMPYTGEKVSLDFYVMSQCPYGVQVEDAIAPVLVKFGSAVDFQIDYIARDLGDGRFQSLHGDAEVAGNIVQLCAQKYEPKLWMGFVSCMNDDAAAIPANWRTCSDQLGLDTDAIGQCYAGEEGKQLLSESIARATEIGAQGSPTIYLNGAPYEGGRQSTDFIRAICQELGEGFEECESMPACSSHEDCTVDPAKDGYCENAGTDDAECVYKDPVPVELIVLNDKRCASCDTAAAVQTCRMLFKRLSIRGVDLQSEEGQELVSTYGITRLPAYLFNLEIVDSFSWQTGSIAQYFLRAGDRYRLRDEATGASYIVNEEEREAYYDNLGITLGDNKPQIDFFVMSYCPYGNQAEEAIEPVLDLLDDKVELKPHYVVYSNFNGGGPQYCIDEASELCSMHGATELNQDIRERCVLDEYGIAAWFDFATEMNTKCTAVNADSCWTAVAEGLGYDTKKIQACFEANAEGFAREDLELGKLFGATGSPAVYIDGESYGGSRTGAGFIGAVCAKFDTPPEECSDIPQIEASASAPAPTGGCG